MVRPRTPAYAAGVRRLLTPLVFFLSSCQTAAPGRPAVPGATTASPGLAAQAASTAPHPAPLAPASSPQIPVEAHDTSFGAGDAPVTVVAFTDLECPFCARAHVTLQELQRRYGPARLRVVVKHNPLSFHEQARPAALWAHAGFLSFGPEFFERFVTLAFERQTQIGAPGAFAAWTRQLGYDPAVVQARLDAPDVTGKVQRDVQLAERLGATGTPAFFINGVLVSGAQPIHEFTRVIDAELAETRRLMTAGTAPGEIYARRVAENWRAPEPRRDAAPPPEDLTIWRIPVDGAASSGPRDALVTLVVFTDLQCPFCARAHATVQELQRRYRDELRVVVRHNPLPFHPHAMPAAELAAEARAQRGDAAFFDVVDRVFARESVLSEKALLDVAQEAKLDIARVKRAWAAQRHRPAIERDAELALDYQARGTPHFFINGRRLSGAQPIEKFEALIQEQLEPARRLRAEGVRDVYSAIMKTASTPPPPESVDVDAPTAAQPSRGPAGAPIVVQVFSDFECPFCARALPTLEELLKENPGRVRLVWRNKPLPFHRHARAAAAAALEVRAQRGDAAFWKMHDLLFRDQREPDAFSETRLRTYATELGADADQVIQATRDGRHDAAIEADLAVAERAGISGTPTFTINGFLLTGAQPIAMFRRVLRHAQAAPQAPRNAAAKPSKRAANPPSPAGSP